MKDQVTQETQETQDQECRIYYGRYSYKPIRKIVKGIGLHPLTGILEIHVYGSVSDMQALRDAFSSTQYRLTFAARQLEHADQEESQQ